MLQILYISSQELIINLINSFDPFRKDRYDVIQIGRVDLMIKIITNPLVHLLVD